MRENRETYCKQSYKDYLNNVYLKATRVKKLLQTSTLQKFNIFLLKKKVEYKISTICTNVEMGKKQR